MLASALLTAGCGSKPEAAPPADIGSAASSSTGTPVLSLDFDDLGALDEATGLGQGYLPVDNEANQPVTVRVASVEGGALRAEPGRDGGYAARFPAHRADDPRRAVLSVTTTAASSDPLGPGVSDFSFGADFKLDAVSEAGDGEGADNGNNLLQRGLSSDDTQYKLQIDAGRVSCRVAGADGELLVKSKQEVAADTWYRASCARTGDAVRLEVDPFDARPERTSASGPTGSVHMPPATPLVVGGKAAANGDAVAGDSDQFNGAIDNVFLTVDDDA